MLLRWTIFELLVSWKMGLRTFFVQAKSSNLSFSHFWSYDLTTKRKADVLDFSLQCLAIGSITINLCFFWNPRIPPELHLLFDQVSYFVSFFSQPLRFDWLEKLTQAEQFAKLQIMELWNWSKYQFCRTSSAKWLLFYIFGLFSNCSAFS